MATIRQIRTTHDDTAYRRSPSDNAAVLEAVTGLETEAQTVANASASHVGETADRLGAEGFEMSSNVITSARALTAEVESGRVPLADARKRLADLTRQLQQAADRRARFEAGAARAAEIAADPIGFVDTLQHKYPSTQFEMPS